MNRYEVRIQRVVLEEGRMFVDANTQAEAEQQAEARSDEERIEFELVESAYHYDSRRATVLYVIIESFGLIPELVSFTSSEDRDDYVRNKIKESSDVDAWIYGTSEGNYDDDSEAIERLVEKGTEEEKLAWLVGQGFLSDGNKNELRTDELTA